MAGVHEQKPEGSLRTRTYLIALAVIAACVLVIYVVARMAETPTDNSARADLPPGFDQRAPTPTPADHVLMQRGFDHLVSYTDAGFEPSVLRARTGERVRFVNNTGSELLIMGEGVSQRIEGGAYAEASVTGTADMTFEDGRGAALHITIVAE